MSSTLAQPTPVPAQPVPSVQSTQPVPAPITHEHHVLNALRNAVSYRLKHVFGNPVNMTRAEQHEHACLVEAEKFLMKHRDELLTAQVNRASRASRTDSVTGQVYYEPVYPQVLVGPGGQTRRVEDQTQEATARADGFDFPPADPVLDPALLPARGVLLFPGDQSLLTADQRAQQEQADRDVNVPRTDYRGQGQTTMADTKAEQARLDAASADKATPVTMVTK